MAIIKCKMCGGDLTLLEGQSVAECEYCGSRQTVPAADNEKKLTLFARANRLRASCDFDKAAGIYESIVADFPAEAESYWGLVLCKYGIEYVDDPATGKKIPTCHRSSFDSVMDDPNFEQALENADAVALRVYREEAKQIETIRKGILEVSSNEQPYDIFICYKETAENGDRTVDSVMAQDIYDALTDKGYRVFFSRITLEDKLGQAYEPYIFAALNSAKIMLAVGTCYEYYNAVWVKNEWSRYLKIIAQDKNKYLIPCYKNIDAYDIPKEFAHLQAQDMGKVGALQDLLRGIEKIIPKKNTTVIQERVLVGSAGDNKIASLLDRGNMALEDGDWAKADSFFEDVLNNDSKNAQAYIGKTLAQERCRTLDSLVRKRKDAHSNPASQKITIPQNRAHIDEKLRLFYIPGYLKQDTIRELYQKEHSFSSLLESRKAQLQEETKYWANHKLLTRAEQFATGDVAQALAAAKTAVFNHMNTLVKQEEAGNITKRKNTEEKYVAFLAEADEKLLQLHREALENREKDYRRWVSIAQGEATIPQLNDALKFFTDRGSFEDSVAMADHCRARIDQLRAEQQRKEAEEKAAAEAEAERQRVIAAKLAAQRKRKMKLILIVVVIVAVLAASAYFVVTNVIIPGNRYQQADAALESGNYEDAITSFLALSNYKDSAIAAEYARARQVFACASTGSADDVTAMLKELNRMPSKPVQKEEPMDVPASWLSPSDFLRELVAEADNKEWSTLYESGEFAALLKEYIATTGLVTDPDAVDRIIDTYLEEGGDLNALLLNPSLLNPVEVIALSQEDTLRIALWEVTAEQFAALGSFRDSAALAQQAQDSAASIHQALADRQQAVYEEALALLDAGEYSAAVTAFQSLGSYLDSPDKVSEASSLMKEEKTASIYAEAESLLASGKYDEAAAKFQSLGNYQDAPQRVTEVLYAKGESLMSTDSYAEALTLFTELGNYKDSAQKAADAKSGILRTAQVGDIVNFGHCELDNNVGNGKEDLPWIVVERNGNSVTLMSKYIIAKMAFDMGKSNSWDKSSLKTWLNSNLPGTIFTDEEFSMVKNTSAGKVYVPSVDELDRWFDVNTDSYRVNAKVIAYTCKSIGRYGGEETWWWWTRTSDGYHNAANCVKYISEGGIFGGNDVTYTGGGIRPCVTITVDG